MESQHISGAFWPLLNNMPRKMVDQVVTKFVLKKDKQTCDNMLRAILEEKKEEDRKKHL